MYNDEQHNIFEESDGQSDETVIKNECNDVKKSASKICTNFEQLKPRTETNTPKSFLPGNFHIKSQKETQEDNIYNNSPIKGKPLKPNKDFVSIQRHEDILDHMKTE